MGKEGVFLNLELLTISLTKTLRDLASTDLIQAEYWLPLWIKGRNLEDRSSGRRPRYRPSGEMTVTEWPRQTMPTGVPGWRPVKVLGSPKRINETVLVIPGSSRKSGGGAKEVLPGWIREAREDLSKVRFLAAIVLNLSRRRTLANVFWAVVLWPSSIIARPRRFKASVSFGFCLVRNVLILTACFQSREMAALMASWGSILGK